MTKDFNIGGFSKKNRFLIEEDVIFVSCPEKDDYLKYKNGLLNDIPFRIKLNFEILNLLEDMGFSIDRIGTYFYKDIIVRIIKRLEWLDTDGYLFVLGEMGTELSSKMTTIEKNQFIKDALFKYLTYLKEELNNPYSQFYFDIARNDKDMGTKTFHTCVRNSLDGVDFSAFSNISLEGDKQLNYGQMAFNIANYVRKLDFYKNTSDEKEKLKPMMRIKIC